MVFHFRVGVRTRWERKGSREYSWPLPTAQRAVLLKVHIQTLMSLYNPTVWALITLSFVSVHKQLESSPATTITTPKMAFCPSGGISSIDYCHHHLGLPFHSLWGKKTQRYILFFRYRRIDLKESYLLVLLV